MRIVSSCIIGVLIISGCISNAGDGSIIDFGDLRNINVSEVIDEFEMTPLETTDESLIGYIDKIDFYGDRIYVLDSHYSSSIFVFSKEGKFLSKLSRKGRGPGEFIYPMSFAIDQRGAILVLDMNLSRLLKYNIDDLSFIEEVPLPAIPGPSPMTFTIDEEMNWYYFYKPTNWNIPDDRYNFIISDERGNVIAKYINKPYSGEYSYGAHSLFHKFGDNIYGFPHYSNKVYEFDKKRIHLKYQLKFGTYAFPDEDFFKQFPPGSQFLKELNKDSSKWIKYMFVSQTNDFLVASYQSIYDYYLGIFDKNTKKTINVKLSDLTDDLGLGFTLPYPTMSQGNYFVGWVDGEHAGKAIQNVNADSNPVLVRYTLKKIE